MVLECSLDSLMQYIRREQLVDVGMREARREWLWMSMAPELLVVALSVHANDDIR